MRKGAAVALAGLWGAFGALSAIAACGSRTGLPELEIGDAAAEFGLISPDRFMPGDRGEPTEEDVVEEPPPGIDVNVPDVPIINPCPPDAGLTLIYVIGTSAKLYSFQPPTGPFSLIGTINCPGAVGTPFSMAVDRTGIAYVAFSSSSTSPTGNTEIGTGLFRVSTKDASCRPTRYDAAKNGMVTFGMGFVANLVDGSAGTETLYISKDVSGDGVLGSIDTKTFDLTYVAPYEPAVSYAELTGTGLGELYAFQPLTVGTSQSFIAKINPATAAVEGTDFLDLEAGNGWAFGFWGGNFYTFTAPSGTTEVNEYDPKTKKTRLVATVNDTISGAGVSTCAPRGE